MKIKPGPIELNIFDPTPEQLELIEAIGKFKGCQIISMPHIVSDGEGASGRQFLFIKPAGPAHFKVGELVYRVLEDGTFEASTVKKVYLNYLIVYSITTEKETSCHFRDVFHNKESGAARTAATERREIWESNLLRSLNENWGDGRDGGVEEAERRERRQVEYTPPDEDDPPMGGNGGFMCDSGF